VPTTPPDAQRELRITSTPAAVARSAAACRLWCTLPLPVPAITMPCAPAATAASSKRPLAPAWLVRISTAGQLDIASKACACGCGCVSGQGLKQRKLPSSSTASGPASPELKASTR